MTDAEALNPLTLAEKLTQLFAQFGPYFIGVVFLCVAPIYALSRLKHLDMQDAELKRRGLGFFATYVYATLGLGVVCVAVGVGVWVKDAIDNVADLRAERAGLRTRSDELAAELARLKDAIARQYYIVRGVLVVQSDNVVDVRGNLNETAMVRFQRHPESERTWVFIVASPTPLEPGSEIYAWVSMRAGDTRTRLAKLMIGPSGREAQYQFDEATDVISPKT